MCGRVAERQARRCARVHRGSGAGTAPGAAHVRAGGTTEPGTDRRGSWTQHATIPALHYLNNGHGLRSWLLTKDHKRIAHPLSDRDLGLLLHRRADGRRHPPRADDAARRFRHRRHLQQDVHAARRDHGVLLPDSVDSRGARQLPDPADDRGQGSRVSADQSAELVHLRASAASSPLYAMVTGGVDTGWTFYTPYSTAASNTNVIPTALGIFITGFSSILTGLNFIVTIHRMRAPGMTWFRLPLFMWSHYATSLIQVLGTPVIAITVVDGVRRARVWVRHLRSGARRRPGAVPAPVLVLLASGRLHHDPAGDGRDERAGRGVLAQEDLRLQLRRVLEPRDRRVWLHRVGAPHVRGRHLGVRRDGVFVPELLGGDSVGGQGVQLDRDALQRVRSRSRRRCCMPMGSSDCLRSAG